MSGVTEGGFAYHRLFLARSRYRWWKPVAALAVGYALYWVMSFVWQQVVVLVVAAVGGETAVTDLIQASRVDQQNASNPLVLLVTLGSLATMLPATLIAVRLLGLGPAGQLTSVVGRIRWRWLAHCLIPAAVFMALQIGLGYVIPADWQTTPGSTAAASGPATPPLTVVASLVVILLLVPLQAAGEEFAFRGFAMQTLGSWVRPRRVGAIVAIVLPTVGFAFAHDYNVWGKLTVASLGVAFAYLTWRTGGLEAGVVAHALNNVVVFALAAPVETSTQADGSPGGLLVTLVSSAVYVALITVVARRNEPERTAPDPAHETARTVWG